MSNAGGTVVTFSEGYWEHLYSAAQSVAAYAAVHEKTDPRGPPGTIVWGNRAAMALEQVQYW